MENCFEILGLEFDPPNLYEKRQIVLIVSEWRAKTANLIPLDIYKYVLGIMMDDDLRFKEAQQLRKRKIGELQALLCGRQSIGFQEFQQYIIDSKLSPDTVYSMCEQLQIHIVSDMNNFLQKKDNHTIQKADEIIEIIKKLPPDIAKKKCIAFPMISYLKSKSNSLECALEEYNSILGFEEQLEYMPIELLTDSISSNVVDDEVFVQWMKDIIGATCGCKIMSLSPNIDICDEFDACQETTKNRHLDERDFILWHYDYNPRSFGVGVIDKDGELVIQKMIQWGSPLPVETEQKFAVATEYNGLLEISIWECMDYAEKAVFQIDEPCRNRLIGRVLVDGHFETNQILNIRLVIDVTKIIVEISSGDLVTEAEFTAESECTVSEELLNVKISAK